MRLQLTADGLPEYDGAGRVRVDCGDYEDWLLLEDCPADVQDALRRPGHQSGGVGPLSAQEPATEKPAQTTAPSVSARELAAALNSTPASGTRGRVLTTEEITARIRVENARADRAEADAETAALRARRERAAFADAERRRHEQDERELDIVLDPAPAAAPAAAADPVEQARQEWQVEDMRLRAYRARIERETIAEQLASQRAQAEAGSAWAPTTAGCVTWFVCALIAGAVIRAAGGAGAWVGPLAMVVAIVATVVVSRTVAGWRQRAITEALDREQQQAEYQERGR